MVNIAFIHRFFIRFLLYLFLMIQQVYAGGAGFYILAPGEIVASVLLFLSTLNGIISGGFHYPIEVFLPYAGYLGVRGRVAEIDRIRDTVSYSKLHRIEIVAQVFIQLDHI